MNRRNWLKTSAGYGTAAALSTYIPFVLPESRKFVPNEEDYIRLHWNENPYGPSPTAMEVAKKMLSEANHYPDDQIDALVEVLANKHQVAPQQVMITAGSTEVLTLLGQDVAREGKNVLMSEQSFPTLAIFAERNGATIRMTPVNTEERMDLPAMSRAIDRQTGLIFLCNPNNPTSTDLSRDALISFIQRVPKEVTVCVDEAYIQYSRDGEAGSLVDMLHDYENLIICRTFSKAYGLAGMRIGYAIGHQSFLRKLRAQHPGLGMANSRIAVAAAKAALSDEAHLKMVVARNEEGRKIVYDAFDSWGVSYAQSATNFIYARSKSFVPDIRDQLRNEGILITKWPNMTEHIRISIGLPEWMEKFVIAAEKFVV